MEDIRKCVSNENVRMCGFLEKKGKMKLMSQWKKYWFVLEERLLLYYRSEIEYTNLSPCRGSLNMGLVSSVRPGSSSGPCIIHVITRTQDVQLRAKNRETQEEWMQALLNSMSLPLVTKVSKSQPPKKNLLGYGSSLENINFQDKLKSKEYESEWTLPRKLDFRKRQISGTFYGGSLDTAIWSKKFRPLRTPSPKIPKSKILEKISSCSKENEVAIRYKNSRLSLCSEEEMQFVGSDEGETEIKCKVHDENRNHDLYSVVNKRKKKLNKTLSDTEINSTNEATKIDFTKNDTKDKSPLEKIRYALSRIPKDKIKSKPEKERNRIPRKRRQSFLQKVFKKKEPESLDSESTVSDPLYDTIENVQQESRNLIPEVYREEEKTSSDDEKSHDSLASDSLYTQVQKPVVGSKSILPAKTMSELRIKLKSRESLEPEDTKFDAEDKEIQKNIREKENKEDKAPSLPPKRVSRPVSPWHDVPTNNAPITSNKTSFYVHKAVVRFNNTNHKHHLELQDSEISDMEDNLKIDLSEPKSFSGEITQIQVQEKKKNDDLSLLLEQLTKITTAPLAEPESTDDTYNSSSESEKLWNKSHFSDPDYDIPRPHKPLSILISEGSEIINSTEFMGRRDNFSDTSSSFQSIEPDSLETVDKIPVQT